MAFLRSFLAGRFLVGPDALIIGVVIFITAFSGCSSSDKSPPLSSEHAALLSEAVTIDIFSARGFLGGSDYERYYIDSDVVWRECGHIPDEARPPQKNVHLEGDKYFSPMNELVIEQRRVEQLATPQGVALRKRVENVLTLLKTSNKTPAPGSVKSLAGPGVFEMKIRYRGNKQIVLSSVDALSDEGSPLLKETKQLFSLVRGIGPVICEQATFFGIGRDSGMS